jgi:hypothetical protein
VQTGELFALQGESLWLFCFDPETDYVSGV